MGSAYISFSGRSFERRDRNRGLQKVNAYLALMPVALAGLCAALAGFFFAQRERQKNHVKEEQPERQLSFRL